MSQAVASKKLWNSYVCPTCRFVFRVAQDHDGIGVVCPACRVMLRLPVMGDEIPPLVTPAPEPRDEEIEEEFEDEEDAVETVAAVRSDRNFIAGLAVAALVLLGLFWWWMNPDPRATSAGHGSAGISEIAVTEEEAVEAKPEVRTQIMKVEAVVKAFLEAATAEEALEQVRFPERAAAKLERQLGGEPYQAPGFKGIVGDGLATSGKDERILSVQVRTADFDLREIALIKENGGLKIDWDSWAGWSEMSWKDFQSEKPTDPKLFRVVLSQVDYYNFGFKDDRKWTSYRLESPDGNDSVYGYVPRTGELDQQIRPVDAGQRTTLLLKLRFPANATSGNQVLIDEVIGDGWVDADATE